MDRKKILLIDDEEDFTDLLKLGLERTGRYEVRAENDPRSGIEAAREFSPNLILLDIIMPDMDGTEVARMIKEDEELKNIPVVFLTATLTREETDLEGGMIGGRPFIAKPVGITDLIRAIEKHIR